MAVLFLSKILAWSACRESMPEAQPIFFGIGAQPSQITNSHAGLIIFDLDGTLVDSMPATAHTFATVGSQSRPGVSYDEALAVYNRTAGAPLEAQFEELDPSTSRVEAQSLGGEFFALLSQQRFELFPDVWACVQILKEQGWFVAVSSGSSQSSVDAKLRDTALDELIDVAFGSDSASGFVKGDPHNRAIFDAAGDPFSGRTTVLVGDTDHDVEIGQMAGFYTIAIDRGAGYLTSGRVTPHLTVYSLDQLTVHLLDRFN